MRIVRVSELREYRAAYDPAAELEATIKRFESMNRPDGWKQEQATRARAAMQEVVATLERFDSAMQYVESDALPPFAWSVGMDADLWNGALLLVPGDPTDYHLEVPVYGGGYAYIHL